MALRLSRRAGPGHPVLFDADRDIPWPRRPPSLPAPRAGSDIAPFRDVLNVAETTSLADLPSVAPGRSVTVGGARIAADPLLPGDALLDDGAGVVPILLQPDAPAAVRAMLNQRFLVIVGRVSEHEGFATLVAVDIRDLRQLDREWKSFSRR